MAQLANIYIRFSTIEQREGTSTLRQRGDCLAHIDRKGWALGDILTDEGKSAFKGDNRAEGAALARFEMEASAGLHDGSILLVERLDRLTRQGHEDTFDLIRRLGRFGVSVATVDGDAFYESGARLDLVQIITMLVKAETAREESEKKSDRLKKRYALRRKEASESQRPITGKLCPAWLIPTPKGYDIDKSKAALVVQIFEMADGDSDGAIRIAKRLNQMKVPVWQRWETRKVRAWDRTRVRKILADAAVIGEFQPHRMVDGKRVPEGEPIKLFPPIVDPELFARVRTSAPTRAKHCGGRRSAIAANLFAGLAVCSECGAKMIYKQERSAGSAYRTKAGNVAVLKYDAATLYCRTNLHDGPCSNGAGLPYGGFERATIDSLLHLALDDRSFAHSDEMAAASRALIDRERDLKHAQSKAERLWSAFAETGSPNAQRMAESADTEAAAAKVDVERLKGERERAGGKVSEAEHLTRIGAIRIHLYDDDLTVRAANRKIAMAGLHSIIDRVECRPDKLAIVHLLGGMGHLAVHPGMGRRPARASLLNAIHPDRDYSANDDAPRAALRRRLKAA